MIKHGVLISLSLLLLLLPMGLSAADIITFGSGQIILHGAVYRPEGARPFPAIVYNHAEARVAC